MCDFKDLRRLRSIGPQPRAGSGLQDRPPSACPILVGWVPTATAAKFFRASYWNSSLKQALRAEIGSIETELQGTQAALRGLSETLASLSESYNNGVLLAPADGHIGSTVANVGDVISGNGAKVAYVYSGSVFALAYVPETYLRTVEEGEK